VALACAAPEPALHPPSKDPKPRTPANAASDRGSTDKAGSAGAAPKAETFQQFSHQYPDDQRVAPAAWLKAHGAHGTHSEKDCWELADGVGVPPAPGILCVFTLGPPFERLARIYRLDGARTKKVWQATIGADPTWLELVPVVAGNGSTIEVRELRGGNCERALCQYAEKEAYGILMDFGPVLTRGCKARGLYTYEGGNFVHTKGPERVVPRLSPTVLGGSGCGD
jgi:hypothetical protein